MEKPGTVCPTSWIQNRLTLIEKQRVGLQQELEKSGGVRKLPNSAVRVKCYFPTVGTDGSVRPVEHTRRHDTTQHDTKQKWHNTIVHTNGTDKRSEVFKLVV